MTDDTTQRELSREQVEALPESDIRALLLTALATIQSAADAGFDELAPLPLQFVDVPGRGDGTTVVPMVIAGNAGGSPRAMLEMLASIAEDNPETRSLFVIPVPDTRLRAAGIFYRGWNAPPDHPRGDDRDPGDIPGAVPARFLVVVTTDGVGLTARWEEGREPLAWVVPLIDHEGSPPGLDEVLRTATGRETDLLHKLHRTALALREAYIDGVSAHPAPPDHPEGYVCAHDHHGLSTSGLPSAVLRGLHPTHTREDVENMPSSPLRDLALAVLDTEEHYDQTAGWGNEPCLSYRHCVDPDGEPSVSIAILQQDDTTAQLLRALAQAVENDVDLRAELQLSDERYVGVSVLSEGHWISPTPEEYEDIVAAGPHAHLPEATTEGRLVIAVARDGGGLAVRRSRGAEPTVLLVEDFDEAAIAFGGDITAALRHLNAVYAQSDSAAFVVPEPTADISLLPRDFADEDFGFATIPYRWKAGMPREGSIYPPLPSDHPLAERPCWCGEQLSDGLPVQAYVCDAADGSGSWQPSKALLLHQRCVSQAAAVLANTMSDLADGNHDDDA
jgi:hypothetical protein